VLFFATIFILLAKTCIFLFANANQGCIMTNVEPEVRGRVLFERKLLLGRKGKLISVLFMEE